MGGKWQSSAALWVSANKAYKKISPIEIQSERRFCTTYSDDPYLVLEVLEVCSSTVSQTVLRLRCAEETIHRDGF